MTSRFAEALQPSLETTPAELLSFQPSSTIGAGDDALGDVGDLGVSSDSIGATITLPLPTLAF
jgi:hypothetical protein